MTKYIITSGKSVVSEIKDYVKITTDHTQALMFDTCGEAMKKASIINTILNDSYFQITSVSV